MAKFVLLYRGTKRRVEAETLDEFSDRFSPIVWPVICGRVRKDGEWFNEFYHITEFKGEDNG